MTREGKHPSSGQPGAVMGQPGRRIDLRSDTLTQPTPEMRRAMMEAVVGDDVYGEDPTVNTLQEEAAAVMGKEAALFVPTGSMGNLVCLLGLAAPGSEVICESSSHVVNYEMASMSVVGGLMPRMVPGRCGRMDPADVANAIHPPIYYCSPVGAISLENTHNLAGGAVLDLEYLAAIRTIADRHGLPVHLDGARIFNAAVSLGVDVREIARFAETVMFCLSKGLCAPVGSMVTGSREFIERARAHRKRLGGGMRQVGVLAAAGRVALAAIPPLLKQDHEKIQRIVKFFTAYDFIQYDAETVKSNILIFQVVHPKRTSADLTAYLAERGVICGGFGDRIRFVTYRDITFEMVDEAIKIMTDIFRRYF